MAGASGPISSTATSGIINLDVDVDRYFVGTFLLPGGVDRATYNVGDFFRA